MKGKVLEIFQSVQGEGKYAGISQTFVRFFGCNMHCVWCDTPLSIGDQPGQGHYTELTAEELLKRVTPLWEGSHSVSITGGEPLVQKDFLKRFLPLLKEAKQAVYLETNGVLPAELNEVIDFVDIIAMDVKLPSSTKCRPFWQEHEAFLKIARAKDVFVKTVISGDTIESEVEQAADLVAKVDRRIDFILQPNYFEMKNGVLKKCLEFQRATRAHLPNVRVLPQVHKFMRLR